MTEPARETSGDYGYDLVHDLVHEQTRGSHAPEVRTERLGTGPAGDPGTVDLTSDYSYDSAHDFRR
jgi:hypothetical protein